MRIAKQVEGESGGGGHQKVSLKRLWRSYVDTCLSLNGERGRLAYFAFPLLTLVGYLLAYLTLASALNRAPDGVTGVVFGLFAIVWFWGTITNVVKRLNDLEHSRWLVFVAFIPFINGLFGLYLLFMPGEDSGGTKYRGD